MCVAAPEPWPWNFTTQTVAQDVKTSFSLLSTLLMVILFISCQFLRNSDKPVNIYCTSPSMHPHCHYSNLGPQRPLSSSWRTSLKYVCFPGIAPLTTNLPALFLPKSQIWSYHFPPYHHQYILLIHSFLKIYIWKCWKNCSHSYFLKNNY